MFFSDPNLDVLLRGLLLAVLALLWIIVLVRINGLRSFSKMTNFDFVVTVAMGSLLAGASQASNWEAYAQALIAMVALFLAQYIIARLRRSSEAAEATLSNSPLLLMRDGVVLEQSLASSRVAKSDLFAKLREANVLELSSVRAVILETTGDISVLHGSHCAEELLRGVRNEVRSGERPA